MLSEQFLVQRFTAIFVENSPHFSELLKCCHIELVNSYWGQPGRLIQYFVVYYPNLLSAAINAAKEPLQVAARSIGIADAVCMNATKIIRDPKSTLKQKDPVLWLELLWIAPTIKDHRYSDQELQSWD